MIQFLQTCKGHLELVSHLITHTYQHCSIQFMVAFLTEILEEHRVVYSTKCILPIDVGNQLVSNITVSPIY